MEDYTPSPESRAICDTLAAIVAKTAGATAATTARELGNAGLPGLLVAQSKGGAGLSLVEAVEVMRSAGRHLFSFPLADMLLGAFLLAAADHPAGAAALAGEGRVAMDWHARIDVARQGSKWNIFGISYGAVLGPEVPWLVAPVEDRGPGATEGFAIVDLRTDGIRISPGDAFDIDRPRSRIELINVNVEKSALAFLDAGSTSILYRAASLLAAAEMLGLAEAAFELGKERAGTRRQFGQLIVEHQSVRHQLSRDHLALTAASLSIAHAAHLLEAADARAVQIACDVASAAASVCPAVIENALQLHGALGFTWDMPLHRALRRARVLGRFRDLGTARAAIADCLWPWEDESTL